jgi:hypothetical protein
MGRSAFFKSVANDTLVNDLLNPQTRKKIVEEAAKINAEPPAAP